MSLSRGFVIIEIRRFYMKGIILNGKGGTDVLKYTDVEKQIRKEKELLVEVKSTALNRLDTILRENGFKHDILGLELAGVVVEADLNSSFKVGDKVMGLVNHEGYAQYACIPESRAMPIFEGLSFEEASAIPEVFLTAYQTLFWLGELKENDTVLIHAGASGVGTAAIQCAKTLKNAHVIVTAGSDNKLEFCKQLGADEVFNYKKQDFGEIVKNRADVILDLVGASYFDKNLKAINTDGRWIMISTIGGKSVPQFNIGDLMGKRVQIKATGLLPRSNAYKSELCAALIKDTKTHFENKTIKPIVDSVYNLEDVGEAHKRMEANLNMGKIILKVD